MSSPAPNDRRPTVRIHLDVENTDAIAKLHNWAVAQNQAARAVEAGARAQGGALSTLNAQLKAGQVTREQYVAKAVEASKREGASAAETLKLQAAAAQAQKKLDAEKAASREKLAREIDRAAKTEQRSLEASRRAAEAEYDRTAKAAEKSVDRVVGAYKKAADADERTRRRGNPLASAILSTRFNLPGSGGAVQPLIGRTAAAMGMSGGAAAGLALAGGAAAAGGAFALEQTRQSVRQAADLEAALNELRFQAKATAPELAAVREEARALGADARLPATSSVDAARAMLVMSKAGFDLSNSMASARGSLALAAAAGIDAGQAADITAGLLRAFNLEGREAGRVADLLAGASNNSTASMAETAQAAQQAAAVYKQAGFTVEELAGDIAMMANAGIKGSDAGTSLKTAVLSLIAPSDEAKKLFKAMGVEIYDASGRLRKHDEIIKQVNAATRDLTDEQRNFALKTIFGTDAIRAANIVYAESATKVGQMRERVGEANAAMDTAESRAKGLKGSIEGFNSALETFQERWGSRFLDPLTRTVKVAGDVVGALDKILARQDRMAQKGGSGWLIGGLRNAKQALDAAGDAAEKENSPAGRAAQARLDAMDFRAAQTARSERGGFGITADRFRFQHTGVTPEVYARLRQYDSSLPVYGMANPADIDRALAAATSAADKGFAAYQAQPRVAPGNLGGRGGYGEAVLRPHMEAAGRAAASGGPKRENPAIRAQMEAEERRQREAAAKKATTAAEKVQRDAEQAAKRTASDRADAETETARRDVARLTAQFEAALAVQKTTTDQGKRRTQREALLGLSERIAKAQETLAVAVRAQQVQGDPANTRGADERLRTARLVDLPQAGRDRLDAINEAQKAAKALVTKQEQQKAEDGKKAAAEAKKAADAEKKRLEDEQKRADEFARAHQERLEIELRILERARENAVTLDSQEALTETIFRRQMEIAQAQWTQGMLSGDPNYWPRFVDAMGTAEDARARSMEGINTRRIESMRPPSTTPSDAESRTRMAQEWQQNGSDPSGRFYTDPRTGISYDLSRPVTTYTKRTDGGDPHGQDVAQTDLFARRAMESLSFAASASSGDFLRALFSGERTGTAGQTAVRSLARNVGQSIASSLNERLIQGPLQRWADRAGDKIGEGILRGGKGAAGEIAGAALLLMSAANLFGRNGGRKQRNSWLGAAAGLAIGSLLPGVSLMTGAGIGAFLGGSFDKGGVAPGRKVSLVHANELIFPEQDMRVLPADVSQRLLTGRGGTGSGDGRPAAVVQLEYNHFGDVNDRADRRGVTSDIVESLDDYLAGTGAA